MKVMKLAALGLVSLTVAALGANQAQAVEIKGDATGTVKLNSDWTEGGIIDPPTTGPGTVEPPEVVEPQGDKDLALMYWPSFDFGEAEYDMAAGLQLYAKPFVGTAQPAGTAVTRSQFVQIRSAVSSWNLTAEAGEFVNQSNQSDVLHGAQILLLANTTQKNTAAAIGSPATAAKLSSVNSVVKSGTKIQAINLSEGTPAIGSLTNGNTQQVSVNSFNFGPTTNVTAANYKSIMLEIPAGLNIAEEGEYVADLTWTLSSDAI